MFCGFLGKDFFAVELSAGQLYYIYDVGFGVRLLHVGTKQPINDNQWHDVSILQLNAMEHFLRVDNVTKSQVLPYSSNFHFETEMELYVGGVAQKMYPSLPKQVPLSRMEMYSAVHLVIVISYHHIIMSQHMT